jgi:UV excision repair protein RAD23
MDDDDAMAEAMAAAMRGGDGLIGGIEVNVELSEADRAAIARLEAMGFDKTAVIEAYLRWGERGVG